MMTNNTSPLNSVEEIIKDTLEIIEAARDIPHFNHRELEQYQKECHRVPGLIRDGRLKIAVAGVIKSGKSTFVNFLTGKELVQRGAGVITSITTRIRKGKKNQASLFFKSWDNINSQLQGALQLFPENRTDDQICGPFDIRRKKDRQYLEKVYHSMAQDFSVTQDEIRQETLLISYALKGFYACKDLVQADESTTCFSSNQFDNHKEYTSDPSKAFYVKDVCLDVHGKAIDPHIEIADCQGADSTDPAQLIQVLNYLESSNLIVYCISSRTGLRQADIMFLKRIKRLGRLDNILFVNNCDLSEHESLEDLIKIETSIRENLELLEIEPRIFSFSALYNLFLALSSKLKVRDQGRLGLWKSEKKLVEYCDRNTRNFIDIFRQAIEKDQHRLLVSNHLKRLGMILSHLDAQTNIVLDLLSSDTLKQENAKHSLETMHQNASRLETIVANSIDGAVIGLGDEIKSHFDEIFEHDKKEILYHAGEFMKAVSIDVEKYRPLAKESGFNRILYLLFQDVKRTLDVYVIETVWPQLKQFVKMQESKISSYFQSLFNSYQINIYESDLKNSGTLNSEPEDLVDIENIKKILGLKLPDVIFEAEYTPKIKMNVFTDFGVYTLMQIVKSIFSKKKTISFSPGLNKAALKIKQENLKVLKKQFAQCRMELEDNYFAPLVDASVRNFKEKITQRFNRYQAYKQEIDEILSLEQSEKENQKTKILTLKKQIQKAVNDISAMEGFK